MHESEENNSENANNYSRKIQEAPEAPPLSKQMMNLRTHLLNCLQMNIKKHIVYASIVFIWIVLPALEITFTATFGTYIVHSTCVRFPVEQSDVTKKIIALFNFLVSYALPVSLMMFCYARVVHAIRTKVGWSQVRFV